MPLHLLELVYLAAPFDTPEERTFNKGVVDLLRAYNFPLFVPQELSETGGYNDEDFTDACMEALNRSTMVLAIFYGEAFDPVTAFEVGYALGRKLNVVAVQNLLDSECARLHNSNRTPPHEACMRVITVSEQHNRWQDLLIPVMNRYFQIAPLS